MLVGVGKTDFFENAKYTVASICSTSDSDQRFVLTTRFTGMYRFEVFGECRFA